MFLLGNYRAGLKGQGEFAPGRKVLKQCRYH